VGVLSDGGGVEQRWGCSGKRGWEVCGGFSGEGWVTSVGRWVNWVVAGGTG
jgi:hypothetical protein